VIDPGPDVDAHVRALASRAATAETFRVLVTHAHADHAAAARPLSELTGAEVYGPADVEGVTIVIGDGYEVETDRGSLVAVHTPGHMKEHLGFHWKDRGAFFAGDLVLGKGDTTWVAEYPGCVADYLDSIKKLQALELDVLYPTHGPPLSDPGEALTRFAAHRMDRVAQVEQAMTQAPDAGIEQLLDIVYGDELPSAVRGAARMSLSALVDYVNGLRR
jgi:glyoxylase-like metal-dependent hydrolase (beta-lactamase superfamily II)